jgi:MoxR-like ATPase
VLPDDVKALVVPVMAHRLLFRASAEIHGASAKQLLEQVVEQEPVPTSARSR